MKDPALARLIRQEPPFLPSALGNRRGRSFGGRDLGLSHFKHELVKPDFGRLVDLLEVVEVER
eukprot:CAMPEP_0181275734 /NCGR_PEP_ID=MMETSP1097-20121128/10064_1 /TAXON_ID=35684 /ORGANISM="Pseudopedinella elastica, Strain CCMP716" /LENGTH=62 /DNA_ID=CAMNT_0023377193 /DNA_START=27 /DNA_END=212 /DNA_ORIENTATION=-